MKQDEKKKEEKPIEENQKKEEKEHEEKCVECKEELAQVETRYKRALADYQNLEKRSREERSDWIKQASKDILLRLLPLVDTLSLANKHEENQTLKVAYQQFLDILKSEGVTKIETVGKKFDPHLMECIDMAGDGDEVIEEVREGYMLHDKLLRVAQVRVGKIKS